MSKLVARKSLYYLSVLFALTLLTFLLFNVLPTDPARIILGIYADEQAVAELRRQLGLDKPLSLQYVSFLEKLIKFDLGRSYVDNSPVSSALLASFSLTLKLCLLSLAMSILYSFSLNYISYAWNSSVFRKALAWMHLTFISTPTFFSSVMLALLFGYWLPIFPLSGYAGGLYYLILPGIVLALYPAATLTKVLDDSISNVLKQPYIRAAQSFGFSKHRIFFKYVLRNALIPWISILTNQMAILFAGAFIVENVFSLPGLGQLVVKSILRKDYPMLQGIVILNGALFILLSIGTDIAYLLVDPRIRTQAKTVIA